MQTNFVFYQYPGLKWPPSFLLPNRPWEVIANTGTGGGRIIPTGTGYSLLGMAGSRVTAITTTSTNNG